MQQQLGVRDCLMPAPAGAFGGDVGSVRRGGVWVPQKRWAWLRPLRMTQPKRRRGTIRAVLRDAVHIVRDGASAIALASFVAVVTMWADVIVRLG